MEKRTRNLNFTPVSLRLFRATAILFCSVVLAALIAIVFWGLARLLGVFYNLLVPLIVAGILTLILQPVVDFLQKHLRVGRVVAIAILYVLFLIVLGIFFVLMSPVIHEQAQKFIQMAPFLLATLEERAATYFPGITSLVSSHIEGGEAEGLMPQTEGLGSKIMGYLGLVVGLGFVPLYLFFALLSVDGLRRYEVEFLSIFEPETQRRVTYFVDVFLEYMTTFFRGQMVIAMIMGIMFAGGFALIGLNFSILIGLVLGLFSIVPFLGTILGLLIVLPMAYFQADGGLDLLLFAVSVFAVVQLIESWFLTPRIMANRTGLPPVIVVMSVFFWGITLGGIAGMLLAIPLTAFFVTIWSQIKAGLMWSLSKEEHTTVGTAEYRPSPLER